MRDLFAGEKSDGGLLHDGFRVGLRRECFESETDWVVFIVAFGIG